MRKIILSSVFLLSVLFSSCTVTYETVGNAPLETSKEIRGLKHGFKDAAKASDIKNIGVFKVRYSVIGEPILIPGGGIGSGWYL